MEYRVEWEGEVYNAHPPTTVNKSNKHPPTQKPFLFHFFPIHSWKQTIQWKFLLQIPVKYLFDNILVY